ncbi:MAG: type II toxin-antitoxin system Phd/YefM family antitoxin [Candidatus Aminicenantes bacterium]|nr:type II toxin-antitoxin system Phd/YefM family antitoxin [Candidatus Aminicenantes bacterium]
MNIKESIRPIKYLESNAADVLNTVTKKHTPMIITDDGEAKMVIQDIESYYKLRQSMGMLKLVLMGKKQVDEGKTRPADQVFNAIERKLKV